MSGDATSMSTRLPLLPVGADGLLATGFKIPKGTQLVSTMLVNNEIGVIQPISELAEAAHQAGALFLCDAVQGFGRMEIPDGPDLIAISAHKIHGPKGIGALWVRNGIQLEPLLYGGGQEGGLRSGTLSPALCAGFGVAAKVAQQRLEADAIHVQQLWNVAISMLPNAVPFACDAMNALTTSVNFGQSLRIAQAMLPPALTAASG